MKTLYLVGGTMGIGKTTTCQLLKEKLSNSVFLDGDWCWDASPFQVTEETKTMVQNNICYLLNNFIQCQAYDHVIFCWVMHQQSIIDSILKELDTAHCNVKVISLICDERSLRSRLQHDVDEGIRTADVIERSVARIPLYQKINSIKINTSNKSIEEVAREIINL